MRLLPVTLAAVALALPSQVEVVVRESAALAEISPLTGFGDHPRPWAADLQAADLQAADPQAADPQAADPQAADPQAADPQAADPQAADPQAADPQAADLQVDAPDTAAADPAPAPAGVDLMAAAQQCEPVAQPDEERFLNLLAREKRVRDQVAELAQLKAAVEELLRERAEMDNASVLRLVNIYRNMKPVEAARILEEMDPEIVVEVIEAMKERDAAPIVASMSEEVARRLTRDIAMKRSLANLDGRI